jgi:transposase InsO family protein
VSFFRNEGRPLRQSAWALSLSAGTLSKWDGGFDADMTPLAISDNRGKSGKVTADVVRRVVEEAEKLKNGGNQIRLDAFSKELSEKGVKLSPKVVGQILIANGLRDPDIRKRRPAFYQSLRRQIPNGVLGLDGSEFTVWHGDLPITVNIELATDIGTHTHTAFSVGDTETCDEVMKVPETHINKWGPPLAILCDSGTANLSGRVRDFAAGMDIGMLPAGPGNPKGNGSLEGAFAHLKDVVGTVRLDVSSPRALVKSVLETVIRVYVTMRNKIPLRTGKSPLENMSAPVSAEKKELERTRLKNFGAAKTDNPENTEKIERVRFLIRNKGIKADPDAVRRAEKSVTYYDTEAIAEAETAFLKAADRDPKRLSLPYFFGILKNVQKRRDDEARAAYCREKYNYQRMREIERMQQEPQEKPNADGIVSLVGAGIEAPSEQIRRFAFNRAKAWTEELVGEKRYLGPLKKRFLDAIGKLSSAGIDKKEKIWNVILEFLNPGEKCVT